jgi:type IV fimbrial biogenesis protein FimT
MRVRGLTLIELMVTLAVVAIGATLAAPSFLESLERSRLKEKAGAVADVLEFAKSEGLKRSSVTTTITPASGTTPWRVRAAVMDGATTLEAKAVEGAGSSVTLQAPAAASTLAIDFRGVVTGFVSTGLCADTDTNCVELRSSSGKYGLRVGINPVGQVAICAKGATFGGYRAC